MAQPRMMWIKGDNLKTSYEGTNWPNGLEKRPNVWNYMIDEIINNVEELFYVQQKRFVSSILD